MRWTPETSGRVLFIQIQSRIAGQVEWTDQTANYDPAAGEYRFTSNAPDTLTTVRWRFRMVSGVFSPWQDGNITTAPVTVPYREVTGTPTGLKDINEGEGDKLDGVEEGATVGGTIGTDIRNPNGTIYVPPSQSDLVDLVPPAIPTNLNLTSTLTATGAKLRADWTPPADSDLAGFDVGVSEGAGGEIIQSAIGAAYEAQFGRNVSVNVRVRAYDKSGNRSGWTAIKSHTAARDTVPPSPPGSITTSATYQTAFVALVAPADADLAFVKVLLNNASGTNIQTKDVSAVPGAVLSTIFTGLAKATSYSITAQAYDTSGNGSTVVGPVAFATTAGVDLNDFTPGLVPPRTVTSLPSATGYTGPALVYSQSDGKLYRYFLGAWTAAVSGGDITVGTLNGNSIIAGTVATAQLAAGAVTARALAIGNPDNVITDGDYRDRDFWDGTNAGGALALVDSDSNWKSRRHLTYYAPFNGGLNGVYFPVEPGATYKVTMEAFISGDFSGWFNPAIHMPGWIYYSPKNGAAVGHPTNGPTNVSGFTTSTSGVQTYTNIVTNNTISGCRQWQFLFGGVLNAGFIEMAFKIVRVSDSTLIQDGAITTDKITVNSLNGDRIQVGTLSADRIAANSVMTGSVQVSTSFGNQFLSTVGNIALDPASRINAYSTQIDPGKIVISGGTTLADWRQGGDNTKIAGGSISTNTIAANKLTIGSRNLKVVGVDFRFDRPTGRLGWTSGYVFWNDDNNNPMATAITGSSILWGGGSYNYVYWPKGSTALYGGVDNWSAIMSGDNVIFATWANGTNFNANYAGTIIDG